MTEITLEPIFEQLETDFATIEAKYGTAESAAPELKVIVNPDPLAENDMPPPELTAVEDEQTGIETETDERSLTEQIADLNDRFRQSWPESDSDVPGFTHISPGLVALGEVVEAEVRSAVAAYDGFTSETDPNGFHDYGEFDHEQAGRVMWKFETFTDEACEKPAEHPEDPTRSYRVLMIFLASECD